MGLQVIAVGMFLLAIRGRTGVFQVGVFDQSHSEWLAGDPPEHEIRERLGREGMRPLSSEVLQRVASAVTSPREAARVSGLGVEDLRNELSAE